MLPSYMYFPSEDSFKRQNWCRRDIETEFVDEDVVGGLDYGISTNDEPGTY